MTGKPTTDFNRVRSRKPDTKAMRDVARAEIHAQRLADVGDGQTFSYSFLKGVPATQDGEFVLAMREQRVGHPLTGWVFSEALRKWLAGRPPTLAENEVYVAKLALTQYPDLTQEETVYLTLDEHTTPEAEFKILARVYGYPDGKEIETRPAFLITLLPVSNLRVLPEP